MLRSRSFHKSTPNLVVVPNSSVPNGHHLTRVLSTTRPLNQIVGRDELEERYLDLRDQHQHLRRDAHQAQEEVRQLNAKLQRLIEEKKRYFKHRKSDREIALEEQIYDLEQELFKQARNNDRLRDRIQLMRVQGGPEMGPRALGPSSTSTIRVSSAYAHVQSRTDSGLYFQRSMSKSQLDLRPKSGILKNANPQPLPAPSPPPPHPALPATTSPKLPLTATMLMREAKDEIERLESIVAEQQTLLDTLLNGESSASLENHHHESQELGEIPEIPTTTSHHQISYQLTTTTTATTSLTPTSPRQTDLSHRRKSQPDMHQLQESFSPLSVNGFTESFSTNGSMDLWAKYQQLILRQESAAKLSTDVRALIENLYRTLREEKQKVAELRAQLSARQELTLVISEKEKQIETLRKENSILQSSINQCVDKVINFPEVPDKEFEQQSSREHSRTTKYLDQVKATFTARSEAYQQEITELNTRLTTIESSLQSERGHHEQLRSKYDSLQHLSENDQLHIRNLEAKVSRLSEILFNNSTNIDNNESRSRSTVRESLPKDQTPRPRPRTARPLTSNLTTNNNNNIVPEFKEYQNVLEEEEEDEEIQEIKNVDNFYPLTLNSNEEEEDVRGQPDSLDPGITGQLDEILNSLPPIPRTSL